MSVRAGSFVVADLLSYLPSSTRMRIRSSIGTHRGARSERRDNTVSLSWNLSGAVQPPEGCQLRMRPRGAQIHSLGQSTEVPPNNLVVRLWKAGRWLVLSTYLLFNKCDPRSLRLAVASRASPPVLPHSWLLGGRPGYGTTDKGARCTEGRPWSNALPRRLTPETQYKTPMRRRAPLMIARGSVLRYQSGPREPRLHPGNSAVSLGGGILQGLLIWAAWTVLILQ